ncbi:MAG: ATP-dependent zinc metalloprotease FtsH [Synergistaceae bacterium]|nr:ATP-dependent zinc metalloprotease FtsH [Synergistaceae bacterium]
MIKNFGLYLIIIVVLVSLANNLMTPSGSILESKQFTYSEFVRALEANRIKTAIVQEDVITGELTDRTPYTVNIIEPGNIVAEAAKKGVDVTIKPPEKASWWMSVLSSLVPTLLIIGIWLFFIYNMQGGGGRVMSFGKSKAKLFLDNRPKVTFKDVAGCDEAKEELQEVILFLKDPSKFQSLGAKVPRGVLMLGPPGTGKTLLARAAAGEADVAFFSVSGSDFVEMFVGVGASRVRDLFEQARKYQPCLIFVDEMDAVGRQRGAGLGGGHDEREQTLNQLLVELDGFDDSSGIILIAATNRPDILDPALLRPGRFDRQIVVDRPDVKGREEILKVHAINKTLCSDVKLSVIARRTPGLVGADLANLINEAALLATRRGNPCIAMEDFEEGIDRVIAGPERKSRLISEKEKRIIAFHEVGHSLVAKHLPDSDPVHKISIIPRGHAALGYTLQLPEEDRFLISRKDMLGRISILLAGRAAEEIIFGDVTSGAANDLDRASRMARQMVMELGMSERLGLVKHGRKHEEVFLGRDIAAEDRNYSNEIACVIDQEVKSIIDNCHEKAHEILKDNEEMLCHIAEVLLDREVLDGVEFQKLVDGEELPPKEDKSTETVENNKEPESIQQKSYEEVESGLAGEEDKEEEIIL